MFNNARASRGVGESCASAGEKPEGVARSHAGHSLAGHGKEFGFYPRAMESDIISSVFCFLILSLFIYFWLCWVFTDAQAFL